MTSKDCFREIAVCHYKEGRARVSETAEKTEEPSLPTLPILPVTTQSFRSTHTWFVPSPPVTPAQAFLINPMWSTCFLSQASVHHFSLFWGSILPSYMLWLALSPLLRMPPHAPQSRIFSLRNLNAVYTLCCTGQGSSRYPQTRFRCLHPVTQLARCLIARALEPENINSNHSSIAYQQGMLLSHVAPHG